MTVELLQTFSLVSFVMAGAFLLVSVALFFIFDVPVLYGDISGRTAKKAIEAIRKQNESTGTKAYKPSALNAERGKLTDKISQSGRVYAQTEPMNIGVGTEKLETTELLQAAETTLLENSANETTVFESAASETTLLTNETQSAGETTVLAGNEFSVDVEMSFTGSSEIIE